MEAIDYAYGELLMDNEGVENDKTRLLFSLMQRLDIGYTNSFPKKKVNHEA